MATKRKPTTTKTATPKRDESNTRKRQTSETKPDVKPRRPTINATFYVERITERFYVLRVIPSPDGSYHPLFHENGTKIYFSRENAPYELIGGDEISLTFSF